MPRISLVILCVLIFVNARLSQACESCTVVFMGKKEKSSTTTPHVTAKVLYENQDWKEMPAEEAHELHHDGHHVHDKQHEEIIHTVLTAHINERLSVEADIPYVKRHYIEIDSHANLGKNETSQGLGDIVLTGDYRFINDDKKTVGVIAGLKLPSGETKENNSFNVLIEPELQPGTGSLDYIAGLSGSYHPGSLDFSSTAIYIYRTEGEQDFRAGDLFSMTFYGGKTFDIKDKLSLKTGLILNNQLEKKQNNAGGPVKDSGGYTMLVGPQLSVAYDFASLEFSYLRPAIQNLGGVHQKLESGIWTGGVSVRF